MICSTRSERARSDEDAAKTHVFADTRLTEELEQLQLAQCAQTEHGVIEGGDFLDGDLAPAGSVHRRTHNAVRALTDDIKHLVLRALGGQEA